MCSHGAIDPASPWPLSRCCRSPSPPPGAQPRPSSQPSPCWCSNRGIPWGLHPAPAPSLLLGCSPVTPSKGSSPSPSLIPSVPCAHAWLSFQSPGVPEGCSNLLIFGRCCHTRQCCRRAGDWKRLLLDPSEGQIAGVNVHGGTELAGAEPGLYPHPQIHLLPHVPPQPQQPHPQGWPQPPSPSLALEHLSFWGGIGSFGAEHRDVVMLPGFHPIPGAELLPGLGGEQHRGVFGWQRPAAVNIHEAAEEPGS